jgi:hypothetical protein
MIRNSMVSGEKFTPKGYIYNNTFKENIIKKIQKNKKKQSPERFFDNILS